MLGKQKLRFDYVYVPTELDILRSVEIACDVTETGLDFFITSEPEVTEEDLMKIICSVQKDNFDRVRINIMKDCNVMYRQGGVVCKLSFDEDGKHINEMVII